jgi:hypothetical protein
MENCSIYSHHIWHQEIVDIVFNNVPQGSVEITGKSNSWEKIQIFGEKELLKSQNKMSLTCKVREFPSFKLGDPVDEITANLNGIRNYFGAIQDCDPQLLQKLIAKISSVNMEISVVADNGFNEDFEEIILAITEKTQGFIFSNNNSIFDAPDSASGLFNENADVILCASGYSDVKDLEVIIAPHYYAEMKIKHNTNT